ncbi:LPS export ABC transporter periplasmic protein LptC [Desulfurobacterium atlanticum]|uniref:LPS export ABC transporter protein LptC n=1 Tax=Desulfurobacterium atlanticum TaxID=240169 RepID=A0A238XT29_9BACT|nr:LPS export ABC transporter periplasmic protein LptC [Desulfurobacterium atlanticum]SNR61728.1 LPS export ABC transporter protein LptC [Desulfurobacterium atlanticum]
MREKLFKLALLLLLIGLLPLLYFTLKSEPYPKKELKRYKEQTVEKFTFTELSKKGEKWTLKSPKASFKGKDVVILEDPIFKIFSSNSTIYAKKATYNQKENITILKNIKLESRDFIAKTTEGIFNGKTEIFKSITPCIIDFKNGYTIKGNQCLINLRNGKVIIKQGVSTVIGEAFKEGEKR